MTKKEKTLSWDAFQSLGNPENAPDIPQDKKSKTHSSKNNESIRIRRDKKQRAGKIATVIEGLRLSQTELKDLAKKLKSQCGVGGAAKEGKIILQGDHRTKLLKIFKEMGYADTKLSGG